MEYSNKKSERLLQLELLLLSNPAGLRRADIARRIGVHRSTIGRYIDELSAKVPIWEKDYLVGIEQSQTQNFQTVRMNILESLTFHLSAQLYTKKLRFHNPHAASALRKLGQSLGLTAPVIGNQMVKMADALDARDCPRNTDALRNLEKMAEAWVMSRITRLSLKDGSQLLFVPCFLGFGDLPDSRSPLEICGVDVENSRQLSFELEDVQDLDVLDQQYVPQEDHNKPLMSSRNVITVDLMLIDGLPVETLHDYGWNPEILGSKNGEARVRVSIQEPSALYQAVLRYQGRLIIDSPPTVVEGFRSVLTELVALHVHDSD